MFGATERRARHARRAAAIGMSAAALGVAIVALGLPAPAHAQATGTIRGTVVEAGSQRPLTGAQVFIRGTQRGRVTDVRGAFTLPDVPAGEVTVRVESIGYRSLEQTVQVTAGETTVADFELQTSAVGLDEIVVTGTAGRTTKRALGNSLSTVNAEEITEIAPISNVNQLLQGRSAGVTMLSATGVVGGSSRIRIRGAGSINTSNEPVVYVDGIRVFSGIVRTEGNTAQGISVLESFNPSDIESIEVIKGPAASTLYGADAAAGVIQIITKKGRPAAGLQWTANFEYGQVDWAVDQITTYWRCTDAQITNATQYPGCQVFTTSTPLEDRLLVDQPLNPKSRSRAVQHQYQALGYTEDYPCLFPQQQPCNPVPLRTGDTRNLNMSVRGGGESYNFYISGEKNDEDGSFFNNYNNRISTRANFGFVPSPKANFQVNVGYSLLDQQIPQSDNSSNSILRNTYRGQAGGPASQYLAGFRNFHPEFSNKYSRTIESDRLTMSVTGNYNPFSWLENRLTFGLDRNDRQNSIYWPIDQTGRSPFGATAARGSINIGYNLGHQWTVDYNGRVNANLTDDIASGFSAGMQLVKRRTETHGITGDGLVANQLNLVSSAANRSASQGFSEQTSLGFFLQEQVGWKDRLFATAAVRVDDNSAFGEEFSLVVYPKASLSYVISDEDFFNVGWIDELKLRGAWGQAGKAPNPFSADRTYETGRAVISDLAVNTLGTASYGNPNLKAETGQEIELGFEGSLLHGRVGVDFTFFNKQTKDALLSVDDPPSSGWNGNHLVNVGEVLNRGIELSVDFSPIRKPNLAWDIVANFTTLKNELISFGKDAQGNPVLLEDQFGEFLSVYRHREGYSLGGLWATDVKRDANGVPILNAAGQASVVDCIWDPTDPTAVCDEEFLGPSLPTRTMGLTNTFRLFNNLQIYAFADYQGGHWQWCAICSVRTRIDNNTEQFNDARLFVGHPEYDSWGRIERARLLSLQTKEFIYKADFIKLRELSATYSLPSRWIERFGFSRAAFTLSGRNLWLWTKYEGGTDPEVSFTSDSNFATTDYGSIPMQRRWLFSMNFNF